MHSDRGQFRSNAFVRTLKGNGLKGSMGWVGASDNAAMESFFSLLQKNVLDRIVLVEVPKDHPLRHDQR